MKFASIISVVIPCFNEEKNIKIIYKALIKELSRYRSFEVIFVDDGSTDNSITILNEIQNDDNRIGIIQLSRNFGHQAALKAGLDFANGDCVITMDADMQHDPKFIHKLIQVWQKKNVEVVYTVREKSQEKNVKKITSSFFYFIINKLSSSPVYAASSDFRLLDKCIVKQIRKSKEFHLFFRGLIPWMGFRQEAVIIATDKRKTGHSKYTFSKMLQLALSGITSFSIVPLRISLFMGFFFTGLSLLYGGYVLWVWFFTNNAVPGWTSIIAVILLFMGSQLIMTGIIGEYIGKIFEQVKNRPVYLVRNFKLPDSENLEKSS